MSNNKSAPANGVLTTGDVARLLQIAPRTAANLIDRGEIHGWRLPSREPAPGRRRQRGHRRTSVSALVAFCQRHNWPLDPLLNVGNQGD